MSEELGDFLESTFPGSNGNGVESPTKPVRRGYPRTAKAYARDLAKTGLSLGEIGEKLTEAGFPRARTKRPWDGPAVWAVLGRRKGFGKSKRRITPKVVAKPSASSDALVRRVLDNGAISAATKLRIIEEVLKL